MDITALENSGLKKNEAMVYVSLLEEGISLVSNIYEKTGIHRRNIYDALERLLKKGIVTVLIMNGKKHFEAANPDRLLGYIQEKEEGIKQILPELKRKYELVKSEEEGQMFKGIEGIKTTMQDMLNVKKTIYIIGAKGKWSVNELRFFFPRFERERIKKKIKLRQINDIELRNKTILNLKYSEHKFFSKRYSSPTHIWIYGNRTVTVFWGDTQFAFMIKSNSISSGYKKFFNFMWNNLAK